MTPPPFFRRINSNKSGSNWTTEQIQEVWNKGRIEATHDPQHARKDACGHWIQRDQYGTEGKFGWEIDHIVPVAKGGSDDLSNLQPLFWETNRQKGDTWPWSC